MSNYNSDLQLTNNKLQEIYNQVKSLPDIPTYQEKTVIPSVNEQVITPDSGYNGLSKVTVTGDENLKSENIVSGVNIFGVDGTYETGGESTDIVVNSLIDGSLSVYTNNTMQTINDHAFAGCTSLTSVNFPVCTTIANSAFYECAKLASVSFPVCTSIGSGAFCRCSRLGTVSLPACTYISNHAFAYCNYISQVYLMSSKVCTLSNSNAFYKTAIGGFGSFYYEPHFTGTPCIYVPTSLVDAYKTATNWSYFSSYISAYDETSS